MRLAAAVAVGVLLAGLLSWWLSRKITGPVLALSSAAKEIAAGNYAVRVPAGGGGDEISRLSEQFNEMAARLAATEERERQFLMSVSHELRTPLTAIKGHVDAIRDGLFDDPELERASLDVVAGETIRLERLVGDVLDLAKLNAHRFTVHAQEVDIGVLVEHAHASFGEEARRREIDFRLDEDPDAPTIVTDGDRVLQVITNLLANAFRWTPDGGVVSLGSSTDERRRPDRRPRHRPGHPAGRARAHLRAVHLARQPRHGARPADRARARARARRQHRARLDGRRGQPLPARPAGGAGVGQSARRVAARRGEASASRQGLRSSDGPRGPRGEAEACSRRASVTELPRRRSPLRAAFVALRPRQWLKNLLLFAGIIFAAELGDRTRWLEAVAAFVAYCAASSAAYLVNDLRDVDADRQHPIKRRRPIARGELRPRIAVVLAVALALGCARDRRRPRPALGRLPPCLRRAPGRVHAAAQARRPRRRARDRRRSS